MRSHQRTFRSIRRQAGITLLQVMLGLAVVSSASYMAYTQFTSVQQAQINQAGYEEVNAWIAAMYTVSLASGFNTAANATFADEIIARSALSYANAAAPLNVYGQAITAAAAGGNITLTYNVDGTDAADAQANCNFVRGQIITPGGSLTAAANSNLLGVTPNGVTACTNADPSVMTITVN